MIIVTKRIMESRNGNYATSQKFSSNEYSDEEYLRELEHIGH